MRRKTLFRIAVLFGILGIISSCSWSSKVHKGIPPLQKADNAPIENKLEVHPGINEKIPEVVPVIKRNDIESMVRDNIVMQVPDFSLYDLKGEKISLYDFKGKSVILFFWSTWCPYCRVEIPVLAKKYNEIKGNNIELLAIDIGEKADKVAKFLSKSNAEFPVLLDVENRVANSYNLLGIPTFILINSRGGITFQGNDLPEDYLELLR